MIIGVPKEIKNHEYRVGVVPAGVRVLVKDGHQVLIQAGAGEGSGIPDKEFLEAGAQIVPGAEEVYNRADLVMKVKEPMPREIPLLREGQILFAYLHLAPAPELTQSLLQRRIIGVAYETIQLSDGSLPLLTPMSVVAGRMAVQVGSHYLEKGYGGRGVLLGGVPGVARGKVAIIGAGTVGTNAAKIAIGLGAYVTILDNNPLRLAYLDDIFGTQINTLMSNFDNINLSVRDAHLVIGAVLIPGARAPKLVTREMIRSMKPGTVVVDVSVDQGGCCETTKPTTHTEPIYLVDEVIHYGVTNMPAAVSRTSTFALTNVTLPYAQALANKGLAKAAAEDPALAKGINVFQGEVTCANLAGDLGFVCTPLEKIFSAV
ncbi:MAG: alanine dehydrogenase [Deltaproteobacteria bacterium RBG_13_43_22]|nr:MAG: alanine dehydrogenase [Deltaproteobacteria bacterium RBG_13_43_22]